MLSIEITFDKQLMVWLQKMYCFCLAELLVHFEYKFSGTCTSCSMLSICSHLVYAPPFLICVRPFLYCYIVVFLQVGTTGSIAVCISPLTAIIVEHNAKFKNLGIVAEFVGEAQTNPDAQRCVLQGEVHIILISLKM